MTNENNVHDIREDLVAINVDPAVAIEIADRQKDPYAGAVRGIFDAIAGGVAAKLVSDDVFMRRLSTALVDGIAAQMREEFVRANDLEHEIESALESFTDSRDFERAINSAVDSAMGEVDIEKRVEDALSVHTIDADEVDNLDEYIGKYIEENVKVTLALT